MFFDNSPEAFVLLDSSIIESNKSHVPLLYNLREAFKLCNRNYNCIAMKLLEKFIIIYPWSFSNSAYFSDPQIYELIDRNYN